MNTDQSDQSPAPPPPNVAREIIDLLKATVTKLKIWPSHYTPYIAGLWTGAVVAIAFDARVICGLALGLSALPIYDWLAEQWPARFSTRGH